MFSVGYAEFGKEKAALTSVEFHRGRIRQIVSALFDEIRLTVLIRWPRPLVIVTHVADDESVHDHAVRASRSSHIWQPGSRPTDR